MKRLVLFPLLGISMSLLLSSCGLHIRYVARTTPPPYVVYHYWYYPDTQVYYDYTHRVYFYQQTNGSWFRANTLPNGYYTGPSHVLVDVNSDRPYVDQEKHRVAYPPKRWNPDNGRDNGGAQPINPTDTNKGVQPIHPMDNGNGWQKKDMDSNRPPLGRDRDRVNPPNGPDVDHGDKWHKKGDRRTRPTRGHEKEDMKTPPDQSIDKGNGGNKDNGDSNKPSMDHGKDKTDAQPDQTRDKGDGDHKKNKGDHDGGNNGGGNNGP